MFLLRIKSSTFGFVIIYILILYERKREERKRGKEEEREFIILVNQQNNVSNLSTKILSIKLLTPTIPLNSIIYIHK